MTRSAGRTRVVYSGVRLRDRGLTVSNEAPTNRYLRREGSSMTRNGLITRLALAGALVLAAMLTGPNVASAAGGADDPGGIGAGVRQVLTQRVVSTPYRLSVSVVGQTGPAAVTLVSGGGGQTVTVVGTRWGGLQLVTRPDRDPIHSLLTVVNQSGRTLEITLSRGRTVVVRSTLLPPDVLTVDLGHDVTVR